jgi:hypothetical protein
MAAPKGHAKYGGGRAPGTPNKINKEIRNKVALTGKTPLDVMIEVMRSYADEGNRDKASSVAQMAAPYIHPRLTTVDVGNKDGVSFKGEQTVIILPANTRD